MPSPVEYRLGDSGVLDLSDNAYDGALNGFIRHGASLTVLAQLRTCGSPAYEPLEQPLLTALLRLPVGRCCGLGLPAKLKCPIHMFRRREPALLKNLDLVLDNHCLL